MPQYDNTNRGALFKSDRKTKDTDRDYSGSINVDGHDYWLYGWIKDGRSGKFLSLAIKRKDGQAEQKPQQRRSIKDDMADEIPF